MTQGLRGLLPSGQYCSLMEQVMGCFEPYRLATVSTDQLRQLQYAAAAACMCMFRQLLLLKAVLTALKVLSVAPLAAETSSSHGCAEGVFQQYTWQAMTPRGC